MNNKKVILLIRDGWGHREETENNAIYNSPTPNTDWIMSDYPSTLLQCSGEAVGLPEGYQGNSEVGHMTIGSGRIIFQSLAKINKSIRDGDFFEIPEFISAIDNCKKNKSKLHILGLLQTEGVHSHIEHLFALLDLCKKEDFHEVYIHVITDGRDSPVHESLNKMNMLYKKIKEIGFGKIASVSGRFYTMDRDKRWERTKQAYDCIVLGKSPEYDDAISYIKESHSKDVTDEFIVPGKLKGYSGVNKGDSIIFFNFRTDRTREFTQAIVEDEFVGWDRKPLDVYYQSKKSSDSDFSLGKKNSNDDEYAPRVFFVGMTQFYSSDKFHVAFPDQSLNNLLGEVVSSAGFSQLRISETEKYAHVTFFFNGQVEKPNENEDRELIPSPKVATYDLKPEMSVYELGEKLVEEINKDKYDLIVTNLVNCDMVGHTGIKEAIEKAISAVDNVTGEVIEAGLLNDYVIFVFADHGNAEDQSDLWRTSHTMNPVPFVLVSNDPKLKKCTLRKDGGLVDIAPTVLQLMGIEKPEEMTGKSLIMK